MNIRTVLMQTELEHSDDLDLETLMWLVETIKKVSRTLERREQEVKDLESLLRDSDLALRYTLEKKNRDIALLTHALEKKNGEVAILTQSLAAAQTEVKGLNKKVTELELSSTERCSLKAEEPNFMSCAYRFFWNSPNRTISFDKLLSERSYDGGRLDPDTGLFTAGTSGYYTVNYSGRAEVVATQVAYLYIHHNGERIKESVWMTAVISDQGSRTLILNLEEGDTVELRSGSLTSNEPTNGFYDLIFCVHLDV